MKVSDVMTRHPITTPSATTTTLPKRPSNIIAAA